MEQDYAQHLGNTFCICDGDKVEHLGQAINICFIFFLYSILCFVRVFIHVFLFHNTLTVLSDPLV